ncbi:prephenate dehydratase [Salinicoccus sesuvii]|uniref:Prephenate dehydratase n=1 Tax=Salinicoccus sesuvii TaxID=868281 RepID=A0ABV7N4I0_9STAP
MLIGYQGVEGSYSEVACKKFSDGRAHVMKGYATFKSLVDALVENEVDYIALPVENSTSGPITRTIDLMKYLEVDAVEEVYVKIDHALISRHPTDLRKLTRVYSHPEALEQCHAYLSGYHNIEVKEYSDTAEAVRMVRDADDPTIAAIAGSHAAELYGMNIVRENISDNPFNTTRFLFFRKGAMARLEKASKTSLYIESDHSTGSLSEILNIFKNHDVNLLNLTSRPIQHKPFSYGFFIDVEEGLGEILDRALDDVGKVSRFINILGTYQKGRIPSYEKVMLNE